MDLLKSLNSEYVKVAPKGGLHCSKYNKVAPAGGLHQ